MLPLERVAVRGAGAEQGLESDMVQLQGVVLLAAVSCLTPAVGQNLDTMQKLYEHIVSQGGLPSNDGLPANSDNPDPQRTVGFLSLANWHSARHSLPTNTLVVIADTSAALRDMVENGDIVAAMIKGDPLDPDGILNKWPSDTVTPQAILLAPGETSRSMTEAVDASIVRMLSAGKAQQARQNNLPNSHMEIHTCKAQQAQLDSFPFPPADLVINGPDSVLKTVLTTRKLEQSN